MNLKCNYILVLLCVIAGIGLGRGVSADPGLTGELVKWFKQRQKLARKTVGTVEEVSNSKILISIEQLWPRPRDELFIYSYQPTLDPSLYPEVAVVEVETFKWNAAQAKIIVEKDFSLKNGDIARYPPIGTILLDCTDEIKDTPEYRELLNALVFSGFTVVERGNISDFPNGYVVNLDISGKIETVKVISIHDEHVYFIDSTIIK